VAVPRPLGRRASAATAAARRHRAVDDVKAPAATKSPHAGGDVLHQSLQRTSGTPSPCCRAGAKGAGPAGSQDGGGQSEVEGEWKLQRVEGQVLRLRVYEQAPLKGQLREAKSEW